MGFGCAMVFGGPIQTDCGCLHGIIESFAASGSSCSGEHLSAIIRFKFWTDLALTANCGTMTTTVTVRSFTGKAISLQVDPASKVSDVKDRIVEAMGRKSRPALACRGHELRDHQSLSHYDIAARDVYDIAARDVLHICERHCFSVLDPDLYW